ncbi:hypothetical protein D3C85_1344140 [compost metagenome]
MIVVQRGGQQIACRRTDRVCPAYPRLHGWLELRFLLEHLPTPGLLIADPGLLQASGKQLPGKRLQRWNPAQHLAQVARGLFLFAQGLQERAPSVGRGMREPIGQLAGNQRIDRVRGEINGCHVVSPAAMGGHLNTCAPGMGTR